MSTSPQAQWDNFPSFLSSTLNIELDERFLTPDSAIHISAAELENDDPGWNEAWRLIPIEEINGRKLKGYMLRPERSVHKDDMAELITEDLRQLEGFNLTVGAKIELIVAGW